MNKFNVRVYGLFIDDAGQILITDEELDDFRFSKFPGGGLEKGEGLIEALKREFIEECAMQIEIISHFYTTDFYVKSLFSDEQLIAVYYLVKPLEALKLYIADAAFDFSNLNLDCRQSFRLKKIQDIPDEELNFPIDKHVLKLLKEQFK